MDTTNKLEVWEEGTREIKVPVGAHQPDVCSPHHVTKHSILACQGAKQINADAFTFHSLNLVERMLLINDFKTLLSIQNN